MANYYIRHDCPDCGELHGIYDYIEYPVAGLSGCRLSEVYSRKQLALFREFTVHCRPELVGAIDVDRLVLTGEVS